MKYLAFILLTCSAFSQVWVKTPSGTFIKLSNTTVSADSSVPTGKTTMDSLRVNGFTELIGNSGTATIGAGDSVRVAVTGLTTASGVAYVSYKRARSTADTIASWNINTQGQLSIYGKYGWVVGYIIGKR